MKHTRKLLAGLRACRQAGLSTRGDHASVYRKLKRAGYAWDPDMGRDGGWYRDPVAEVTPSKVAARGTRQRVKQKTTRPPADSTAPSGVRADLQLGCSPPHLAGDWDDPRHELAQLRQIVEALDQRLRTLEAGDRLRREGRLADLADFPGVVA